MRKTWIIARKELASFFDSLIAYILMAVFLGISGDVKILKLTSTELDLSKEINTGAPVPINIVIELKH